MNADNYFWKTKKRPHKTKPRTKPLPKAKEAYLEAEEDFEQMLNVLGIKYEKKFQFKTTKHWRFDFHLIEHRILVEISGGPWSGGRGGKLTNKAWSMDRYDHAAEMGYTVVRLESASKYKIDEFGPMQIGANFASQWLKSLKRHVFD
jgi:very-short-patch-repair endonuclease